MDKDGQMIDFLPAGKVVRVLYENTIVNNPYIPVETVTSKFVSIDGIPPANSDNPFLVSSVVLDHLDSSYHNIAFTPDTLPSAAKDANGMYLIHLD
jgi:hypothetical protein